jgi:hypothetical protein
MLGKYINRGEKRAKVQAIKKAQIRIFGPQSKRSKWPKP